jgi:ornithine decarboxylase
MRHEQIEKWESAAEFLQTCQPDDPVYFFSPRRLVATHQFFSANFPGQVTYAVKANDHIDVLRALAKNGMAAFDVASIVEMAQVRKISRKAELHYHNPVRSEAEIAAAKSYGIRSWSIDCINEFEKLGTLPQDSEISVRFKLPMHGAAYDFGEKFGATPDVAVDILKRVVMRGYVPCLTFHPGTQCHDTDAWARHVKAAADIANRAGVSIARLNVGGGFAADRGDLLPANLDSFSKLMRARDLAFGRSGPELVCEPGRAMVADSFAVAVRVKSLRPDGSIIMNDGVYGALSEWRDMAAIGSRLINFYDAKGRLKNGPRVPRVVFGPTCDSLDRVKEPMPMPENIVEGDYMVVQGMGAYSMSLACRFNGYGQGAFIKTDTF